MRTPLPSSLPKKRLKAPDNMSRYIKELAERVQTLEGSIAPAHHYQHQDGHSQRRDSQEFSPPQESDNMQRKRTYSSVSGGEYGQPYQPQRPISGWASQDLPRHLPHPSSAFATPQSAPSTSTNLFQQPNYSPNGLAPTPQWRAAPDALRQQGSSYEVVAQTDHGYPERVADWDESIVDG